MKRIYIGVSITTCLLFCFLLVGCGGSGPGAPGSCGSEDTGVILQFNTSTHSDPAGDQGDMWQIDLYMTDCDGEDEPWGDDHLNFTISSTPIYDTTVGNFLYFESYRVTFNRLSPDYPPIDEIRGTIQGAISVQPFQVSGPYAVLILDFGRKLEIQDVLARGVYPANFPLLYNMEVEFFGEDQYGNDFCLPYFRTVEIAPYNKCA